MICSGVNSGLFFNLHFKSKYMPQNVIISKQIGKNIMIDDFFECFLKLTHDFDTLILKKESNFY